MEWLWGRIARPRVGWWACANLREARFGEDGIGCDQRERGDEVLRGGDRRLVIGDGVVRLLRVVLVDPLHRLPARLVEAPVLVRGGVVACVRVVILRWAVAVRVVAVRVVAVRMAAVRVACVVILRRAVAVRMVAVSACLVTVSVAQVIAEREVRGKPEPVGRDGHGQQPRGGSCGDGDAAGGPTHV